MSLKIARYRHAGARALLEALIEIGTLAVFRRSLSHRALALVLEWAALHRNELGDDWRRARVGEMLNEIELLN